MKRFFSALLVVCLFFLTKSPVFAMSSPNYQLPWDSVNSGGSDSSTSTNYLLRDTVGDQATGFGSSTQYMVGAGYRTGDADVPFIQFSLFTESTSTNSSYTVFDLAQKYVLVGTPSLFSTGDFIAVAENVGLNQKIAVGKIVLISGSRLYVDRWDGNTGVMNTIPSGTNNVYVLGTNPQLAFGSLRGPVSAALIVATRIATSANNGYSVYMTADGGLRSSVHSITDVTDGSVTDGREEYGWHIFGSAAATSTALDNAFSTNTVKIQQNSVSTTAESLCMEYKLSITASTVAGSHSQVVTYSTTANF